MEVAEDKLIDISHCNKSIYRDLKRPYIMLAPLSGVTDVPFRLIARKFGCKFAFTEMVDVNGIYYNNRKTSKMFDRPKEDFPLGAQIVGQDEERIKGELALLGLGEERLELEVDSSIAELRIDIEKAQDRIAGFRNDISGFKAEIHEKRVHIQEQLERLAIVGTIEEIEASYLQDIEGLTLRYNALVHQLAILREQKARLTVEYRTSLLTI